MLVVVEFWHERCPICKSLSILFSEVAEEYKDKTKFAKLNILMSEENRDISEKYGVIGAPILIFFCNGQFIESTIGFDSKESLKQLVDKMIDKCHGYLNKDTKLKTT